MRGFIGTGWELDSWTGLEYGLHTVWQQIELQLEKWKRTVIACDSLISSVESSVIHVGVQQLQSSSCSAENKDEQALWKCLLFPTPLMKFVGLAAGQWASDHGRAHGGGRVFLTLCKYWWAWGLGAYVCACGMTYSQCCVAVSYWYCLCRMKGHIRRFLSLTMWKRAVRKLIHLSLNCSKSSARAPLARWGNAADRSNVSTSPIVGVLYLSKFLLLSQVFLVRKILGPDAGQLYAMKVLKKASLKGNATLFSVDIPTKHHSANGPACSVLSVEFLSRSLSLPVLSLQSGTEFALRWKETF